MDEEKILLLKSSKPTPNKILTLIVMAGSNFCAWCCISLIAPFFPIEAAKKGVSDSVIGAIYSSSELVILIASPIIAKLLSTVSPRFFYIIGLCLFGCCDVMFGFLNLSPSGTPFVAMCFAVRTVEAIGTASVMTASYAIAGTIFPDRTGTVYGLLQTVIGAGFLVGPAVGGGLYQVGGYGLPFWTLGGLVVVCGCAAFFILPQQQYVDKKAEQSSLLLFRSPMVWFGCITMLVALFSVTMYAPVFAQHLLQFNLSQSVIGLIFVLSSATYSLTTPLWGMLLDKNLPPVPFIIGGFILACINMLLFGPAPFLVFLPTTLWLTIVTSVFIGLFAAIAVVGGMKCVIIGVRSLGFPYDTTTFGLVGGVFQVSICLGTFAGPLLGGILTDWYGFGWAMSIDALVLLLPVILICPFLPRVVCRTVVSEDARAENGHHLSQASQANGTVKHEQETYY